MKSGWWLVPALLGISGASSGATPPRAGEADANPPVITTIVTGPSERVFLSANAAFSKIRQTKYNASDETFESGSKPTELLVGVNYSMHDVFQNE